jgi:hypothetical protein
MVPTVMVIFCGGVVFIMGDSSKSTRPPPTTQPHHAPRPSAEDRVL